MSTLDYVPFRNNLYISCTSATPEFTSHLDELLTRIEANSEGKRLLKKIETLSMPIIIRSGEVSMAEGNYLESSRGTKVYTSMSIIWNPQEEDDFAIGENVTSIPNPPHVGFFHELVHTYRFIIGQNAGLSCSHCDPLIWRNDEEYETITGDVKSPPEGTEIFSENAFRKVEGLPIRSSHNWIKSLDCPVGVSIHYRLKIMSKVKAVSEIPSQSLFELGSRWIGVARSFNLEEVSISKVPPEKAALLDESSGDRCYSYVRPEDVRREYFENFQAIGPTEEKIPLGITYVRMGHDEIEELKKAYSATDAHSSKASSSTTTTSS
ncbi:MAG: type III secretion system effector protein [Simkaniaceae bacterium]|nr:type III secretion system effector protein [Simkaniaceae bacterium]